MNCSEGWILSGGNQIGTGEYRAAMFVIKKDFPSDNMKEVYWALH